MEMQMVWYVVAGILVLIGLAGIVLPALPGLPVVFAGMLLASWASGFEHVGGVMLTVLGILTVLSLGVDFLATALGARRVGASRLALIGAVVGTFAGLFLGIIGVFIGPFVGALVGELIHSRQVGQAAKVGMGTWLGILLGTVLKLGLAFAMVGLFAFAWFF
ncbi:MAG: probable membrane protein NMA1128 [uncultured Lysobacter sp.]|uniref:Probable membrane protein NMA1128 n=1 Tax=uncultured Lysobacter sp. TaxID=271060 RepID=A0A6J4LNM9_9GAMM|nr:MAG: probable membrane protein NMA1128 [uncultured Lysobacter sp.]